MAGTLPLSQMDLSVFIRVICGRLPLSACFFTTAGSYFELYFVFLMSSSRLVGLFSESPKGSQGNKHTWLPGMAASQTYKGRHKEAFWSRFHVYNTTDIQSLTDANHERKRAYPFNLCYLCSRKRIRNRFIRFIWFLFRKHVAPAFQIHQIHPFPLSRAQAR